MPKWKRLRRSFWLNGEANRREQGLPGHLDELALLLFDKDVSAQDIADAINAESKRQPENGHFGRRMPAIKKDD
jgi:hypothetical protein